MTTEKRVAIRHRAAVDRLRRHLARNGLVLRSKLGPRPAYFVLRGERIEHLDVDVESMCRDLGLLKPWEKVVPDRDPAPPPNGGGLSEADFCVGPEAADDLDLDA